LREHHELLGAELVLNRRYSRLLEDIPSVEGKLSVMAELTSLFPGVPHFWGHMGRLIMMEFRDFERATEAINKAIELDQHDCILYHIKGMITGRQALDIMEACKSRGQCSQEEFREIEALVERASGEYSASRALSPEREHGYVSDIHLLLRTVDFGVSLSKSDSPADFIVSEGATWYRRLLDMAEGLLEDALQLRQGEERSRYVAECQSSLARIYGNYQRAIRSWRALLGRKDVYQPLVRRQIARTFLAKANRRWEKLSKEEVNEILHLMEDNLRDDPADNRSVRIWFMAARWSDRYGIDAAVERLQYWRANSDSIDPRFYLYALYALQAIDGSTVARTSAEDLMHECRELAKNLRNRTQSIEWLGKGRGLGRLLHYTRLGEWDQEFEKGDKLILVEGTIASIANPAAGQIELSCGLSAFFVPGRGFRGRVFAKGRDENKPVRFYLAFAYDGMRAWATRDMEAGER